MKITVCIVKALLLVAAVLFNITTYAESVSGTVFLDADGDGIKDTGESGVAGVMVSNGEAVTKSSPAGIYSFTFSVSETRFVFVTTPTGYRLSTPLYIKIEPGGGPNYTMDFGLIPDPTPSNVAGADFDFIVGSDIQHNSEPELSYDWHTMEELTGSVDIGFATWAGDLTPNGALSDFQLLRQVEDTLSYPTYNGFGGHDGNTNGMEYWEEVFGPYYYSWDYAGRHFITIVSEPGYISNYTRQEQWVFNDLAQIEPGTDVYMVMHTPEHVESMLNTIASTYDLIGIIRGHYHNTYGYRSTADNIPIISSSPIRRNDLGVFTKLPRIISVSGSTITSQIFPLGQKKRLIVVSPTPDTFLPRSASQLILVNAYNSGSKISSVKYTLSGPSGVVASNVSLTKSTWWSWRGEWDASSAPTGEYVLEVVVTDDQSDSWQKTIAFNLSSSQPAAPALGNDCQSFMGPDNQNRYFAGTPSGRLRIVWAAPVGSTEKGAVLFSAPVIDLGIVIVGVWDPDVDSTEGGVVAFDPMTGTRLWKKNIGAVYHTPLIYGNKIYAIASPGVLYCIDIATQIIDWTYNIYPGSNYNRRIAMTPLMFAGGKIYTVGDYTNAYCINATTGALVWSQNVAASSQTVCGIYVHNGVAYFISQYDIYARNADTGALLYTTPLPHRQRRNGTPMVYDNVLYANYQNNIAAYNTLDQCSEIWRIQAGGNYNYSTPVYANDKIYYTDGASIIARNSSNGSLVWDFLTNDASLMADNKYQQILEASSHALTDTYSFVGSDNGSFYVFSADTGEVISQYFFGPPVKSSATISGNMVFIGCTDGNLYAFGPGLLPDPEVYQIAPAIKIEWQGEAGASYNIFWRDDPGDSWKLADTVNGVSGTNQWIDSGGSNRPKPELENPVTREYKVTMVL